MPLEGVGEKPKKLYEVSIQQTIYVIAEDEFDAEITAKQNQHDNDPDYVSATEIDEVRKVDGLWLNERPYGDYEEDVSCKEFIEMHAPPPPPYIDPNQAKFIDFPQP